MVKGKICPSIPLCGIHLTGREVVGKIMKRKIIQQGDRNEQALMECRLSLQR